MNDEMKYTADDVMEFADSCAKGSRAQKILYACADLLRQQSVYMRQQSTEKWVEWIEPFGPNNEPVYMRVPKSTAIAQAKAAAHQAGLDDLTDEQLFENFKVVHWASSMSFAKES